MCCCRKSREDDGEGRDIRAYIYRENKSSPEIEYSVRWVAVETTFVEADAALKSRW
jgi:hypothetical protein